MLFHRSPSALQMSICDRVLSLVERSTVNLAVRLSCFTLGARAR